MGARNSVTCKYVRQSGFWFRMRPGAKLHVSLSHYGNIDSAKAVAYCNVTIRYLPENKKGEIMPYDFNPHDNPLTCKNCLPYITGETRKYVRKALKEKT